MLKQIGYGVPCLGAHVRSRLEFYPDEAIREPLIFALELAQCVPNVVAKLGIGCPTCHIVSVDFRGKASNGVCTSFNQLVCLMPITCRAGQDGALLVQRRGSYKAYEVCWPAGVCRVCRFAFS